MNENCSYKSVEHPRTRRILIDICLLTWYNVYYTLHIHCSVISILMPYWVQLGRSVLYNYSLGKLRTKMAWNGLRPSHYCYPPTGQVYPYYFYTSWPACQGTLRVLVDMQSGIILSHGSMQQLYLTDRRNRSVSKHVGAIWWKYLESICKDVAQVFLSCPMKQ